MPTIYARAQALSSHSAEILPSSAPTANTLTVEDTDAYVREMEPKAVIEREDLPGGTVIYRTDTAGLLKRYSFTPV